MGEPCRGTLARDSTERQRDLVVGRNVNKGSAATTGASAASSVTLTHQANIQAEKIAFTFQREGCIG